MSFIRLVLTHGLHHAGLSCVSLHWNDVLEAVQRNDALACVPHVEDVLHFGTQFLSQRRKGQRFIITFILNQARLISTRRAYLGGFVAAVVLQSLIQVTVGTGAFSFAHIKYGVDKCVETLLRGHGVAAERQVLCHPDR